MNKGFWMAKGPGNLGDGELAYDNSSRIEPKRSHQWFMDGTEAELFPNKKLAVEVPNQNSFSGLLNSNNPPWGNASSFHSVTGQFTERLFDSAPARTVNFDERNVPLVGIGNMNMGSKVIEDPFGCDSSFGLSISHSVEDPRSGLNFGGIRKVKVSQVKESGKFMSASMGHAYTRGDNSMLTPHSYSKADVNSITMGLSFNRGSDNMISIGDTFNTEVSNFISMGQPYDKGDNSEISMDHPYRENNSTVSIGQSLSKDDRNIETMGQTFTEENGNTILMGHAFKENNNAVSVAQPFSKDDNSITSMGQTFNRGFDNTLSIGHSYHKVDDNTISMGNTYKKVDNNSLLVGHSFSKGESNIISFGGFNDDGNDINTSGRLICSYDLLMGQSSGQISEAPSEKGLVVVSNADALVSTAQITASGGTLSKEQKMTKKAPPNNFPSNVRSLLSTGMLDGVPVKYTAWSREKELRGIIKGSGYLCGCQSCTFSKAINAYEFERHAGCKTKHPNNHIYFENGKTIYGIVQELRNTPQNLLFEVIQTITGSPINQKSFRLWKESFLAATRELQRIYGKGEGKQLS